MFNSRVGVGIDKANIRSLSALARAHDLRELVARTLLTYLELQGA